MTDSIESSIEKSFNKNLVQNSKVHVNLGQDFIVTTEDKVRLCMTNHAQRLATQSAWIGPLSLFLTIILVLLTADFRETFGVPKDTWHAFFILASIFTATWSARTIIHSFRASTSIDQIVEEFKRSSTLPPPVDRNYERD